MNTKHFIYNLERKGFLTATSPIDADQQGRSNKFIVVVDYNGVKKRKEVETPATMPHDYFKSSEPLKKALITIIQDLQKLASQLRADTVTILREF
jgi:hypothetical protein